MLFGQKKIRLNRINQIETKFISAEHRTSQFFFTGNCTMIVLHHRDPEAFREPYHCVHCVQVLVGENSILIVASWVNLFICASRTSET